MKVIAIIAEYNPFHLGHAYQIQKARETFGDDAAIMVVMSGSFVQRGEPAISSKWTRTQAALECGIDLVIELPFTYACASAERFAFGAVSLLNATGIVSDLYFGSECIDIPLLTLLADILCEESPAYISVLKECLLQGNSFAKARELALLSILTSSGKADLATNYKAILKMPNTILALEYLIALKKTNSPIIPSALLRKGADYHDTSIKRNVASASAIRNTVTKLCSAGISKPLDIATLAGQLAGKMPIASLSGMLSEWTNRIRPVLASDFLPDTIFALRTHSVDQLDSIAFMGDQLSRRLKNAVNGLTNTSIEDLPPAFHELSDTKRFAGTRINRALISLLCGQTSSDLTSLTSPEYLRILGFSDRGRYMLRLMRKTATLPQIDKASDFLEHGQNSKLTRMSELDLISTDLWNLKAGYNYGDEYERVVIHSKK